MEPLDRAPDVVVGSATSPRGEVVLRRRGRDGALELRVNGVFVMDSAQTSTEQAVARLALASVAGRSGALDVLVGGLGLGYTLAELARSPDVARLVVAEIEPAVVEWHRAGLVPLTRGLLESPRVRVREADVRELVLSAPPASYDVVVLDVDNGPDNLVYHDNAALYRDDFLQACRRMLRPQGVLVVWSAAESAPLARTLGSVFARVERHPLPVRRGNRDDCYYAYVCVCVS